MIFRRAALMLLLSTNPLQQDQRQKVKKHMDDQQRADRTI
jgi:hypothetical protein